MDKARRRSLRWLLLGLVILGAVPLIWPGDAPWINDEPLFIRKAMECRQAGVLAREGLVGTRGVVYGPLAVWIYTALLHLTSDLTALVVLRALLCTAVTALSLCWLARLCRRLVPALAALAFLSPYLWLYSRLLWDNNFLIPLSALALASYVSFCVRREPWRLWITVLSCACMFLLHLMSLALIVPIAVHLLWFHRDWLRSHKGAFLLALLLALLIVSPYLLRLFSSARSATRLLVSAPGTGPAPPPFRLFRIEGWVFPFLGGRIFSAQGIDSFFGEQRGLVRLAGLLSYAAFPLCWLGMGIFALRAWRGLSGLLSQDADFHLALLCCGAFLVQFLLDGVMQTYGHPHYFNATWICFFCFLWSALSLPALSPLRAPYAASLGLTLGCIIVSVHLSAGNRGSHYGTTLAHQIDIARRLARYHPDSPVHADVQNYVLFPHALTTLRELYHLQGTTDGPLRALRIHPLHPEGDDGWLTVTVEDGPVRPAP